jgi:hypothetical protein
LVAGERSQHHSHDTANRTLISMRENTEIYATHLLSEAPTAYCFCTSSAKAFFLFWNQAEISSSARGSAAASWLEHPFVSAGMGEVMPSAIQQQLLIILIEMVGRSHFETRAKFQQQRTGPFRW